MYCDDCGSTVTITLDEYVERKERLGVVLCYDCRRGDIPQTQPLQPAMSLQ